MLEHEIRKGDDDHFEAANQGSPNRTVEAKGTGKVVKVYEAARTNKGGSFVAREMRKEAQGKGAQIPSHFEPVKE